MTIRIKLPNGKYGQFPDGTPHEEIEAVLQKQFPPTNPVSEIAATPFNEDNGPIVPGNIDLNNRPVVDNPETGGQSTIWSMSIGTPKGEVLIPRISDDGKILSEQDAQKKFHETGKHLGIFNTPEQATAFAKKLHEEQQRQYMQKEPELKGWKGLGQDAVGILRNMLKTGRGFVANIPSNLEKSGEDIQKHPLGGPLHIAGQLGAEAATIGKDIVNSPHDLLKYLLKKNLAVDIPIPGTKFHTSDLIPHIPENTGIEKALGLEENPEKGDQLIRGLTDVAALKAPAQSLRRGLKNLYKGPDLKDTIRSTQAKVTQATDEAAKIFDTVESEVGKRGVANIPIKKSLISNAQSYLPKTPANKELIKNAQSGDYQALRRLQADLRVKGEKALSSALSADNKMGEEILSIRDQVNAAIQNHLEKTGHQDLSSQLNKARKDYREIQKTYFSTPQLAKVFGKSQKVPKNPMTLLTEESSEMKRFMDAHPEVEKMLAKALKHQGRAKAAKIALGVAGIGTSAEVAHKLIGGR